VSVLYGHKTRKRKHKGDVGYMEINSTVYILRSGVVDLFGNWDWSKEMLEEVPSLSNRKPGGLLPCSLKFDFTMSFFLVNETRRNFFPLKHSG
jgi:hypothetical protein